MVAYLACELGPRGITVVGVSPGWMDGDSIRTMLGPFCTAAMDTERATYPLRAAATPDDVAEMVAMLCGPSATYLSGSVVEADGAGVFAFWGRYSSVGAQLAMSRIEGLAVDSGEAPAVPR